MDSIPMIQFKLANDFRRFGLPVKGNFVPALN
jgi:hypothetical protein